MQSPPNAQGIMGALSQGQAPRQPAPSPNSASPMAGLGSVEDRVAAYRGNPAPLQQRYQMTQDLLDLLALQKIKSEKETAARQLQLQMTQHQAAEGDPAASTVAQQREKEVAQMVGGVAQQDGARKEAALRQMMSGIAGAPGANAAAQPQAMAAGGIVGYAEGDLVDTDERRRESRRRTFIDREEPVLESRAPTDISTLIDNLPAATRPTPPARTAPTPRAAAPTAPVTAASLVAPMPDVSTLPAAPTIPSVDVDARMAAAGKRMRDEHAYTDEERAIRDEGIAQLRRRLADRSDPEKNRMAGIMQALLAGSRGGPRNVGALAGFAEGSIAADRQQRLEREAAEKELQAVLATGRTDRLAGVAAGQTAEEAAGRIGATREGTLVQAGTAARGQTMQALVSISDRDTRANIAAAEMAQKERLAAADRAIQSERIRLDRQLRQEDSAERRGLLIENGITAATNKIRDSYKPMIELLAMQVSGASGDKKKADIALAAYNDKIKEMDAAIEREAARFRVYQPSSQLRLIGVTPAPTR